MHFIARCLDVPEGFELRAATRPAHIAWIEAQARQIQIGGPLLDEAERPIGSLLIVEAESPDAARALLAGDPYARAGLFEKVEIAPWKWIIGRPGAG